MLFSSCKRDTVTTEKRLGDVVQHICREHKQKADQKGNLGAKGVEHIAMEEKMHRKWKAIRGWWDGSAQNWWPERVWHPD